MAAVILPPVPSVCRFAVSGTNQGQKWVNVFHLRYSQQPGDPATLNSVCQAVHTAYVNAFMTIPGAQGTLQSVEGQDLASRTAATGSYSLVHAGTGGGYTYLPVQVAIVLSWQIQDRYRGGHPRTYFPFVNGVDVPDGRTLTATGQLLYANAAAAFLTNMNAITAGAGTWRMVCVRYFSQHQLLPNPYVRDISSSVVHSRIDTQRRRLGKELP